MTRRGRRAVEDEATGKVAPFLAVGHATGQAKQAREGRGRVYTQVDLQHLSLILKGRKLGFTIAEIGQMIAAEEGQPPLNVIIRMSPSSAKRTR